ncbi:hypothetical protein ACFQVC_19015 [Streptomyces monticola]|uniref:PqqD family protein n=1 Tax=Streptomyces monticola TaxID=2666263 RepID=A0ABW2JLI3_9ACTN
MNPPDTMRLLPWSTPDGKACFLLGDGYGYLSRIADSTEAIQLAIGHDLLDHVASLLDCPTASPGELRFAVRRLTEALGDVLRVAESRGARLPYSDAESVSESEADSESDDFSRVDSADD